MVLDWQVYRAQHRQIMSPGDYFCNSPGHDSNYNCQILFEMEMTPNIKQGNGSINCGNPYRSRAVKTLLAGCVAHGMGSAAFLVVRLGV